VGIREGNKPRGGEKKLKFWKKNRKRKERGGKTEGGGESIEERKPTGDICGVGGKTRLGGRIKRESYKKLEKKIAKTTCIEGVADGTKGI